MHILVLSSKFPYPLKDGGAIATNALLSGLANLDNRIYLLSLNTQKHFVEPTDIPQTVFAKMNYALVDDDTSPKLIAAAKNLFFSSLPYILERFNISKFKEELIHILQSNTFDIIQIEGLYLLQYIEVIKSFSKAKIAFRPHNVEFQIWQGLSRNNYSIFKNWYFKILSERILNYEKSIINKYDLLIPISEEDYGFFKKFGNVKPFLIVPTGFDFNEKDSILNVPTDFSLYFIGSLEWLPNQEGIIWFIKNCWNALQIKYPALKIYIAGRNAPANLIRLLDQEGIFWSGEIENASEFIKDKSVMIVPLLSGSGMRIKIIEAFVHGKPVVSTNLGSRGTLATNNDDILIADSPLEFVQQISKLIDDVHLFRKLAIGGHELAKKNFNKELISISLFEFYKKQTGLIN